MAIESQGTYFYWGSSTSASTAAANQIGQVTDFSGPGGAAAVIDISHLGSTAKEKMMGLPDEGQLTMTLNYQATDAGQILLRNDRQNRTMRKAVVQFPDPTTNPMAIFDGYCLNFSVAGAVDNKITANVVIEIANKVTWSTVI